MTEKHAGGRPSGYDPAYCDKIVELGKQGKGPAEIACELGVVRTTLLAWSEKYPEFLTALGKAKDGEQAWWEKTGRDSLHADKFQQSVWAKSMQARFRDDYTERKELGGIGGGPVEFVTVYESDDQD